MAVWGRRISDCGSIEYLRITIKPSADPSKNMEVGGQILSNNLIINLLQN